MSEGYRPAWVAEILRGRYVTCLAIDVHSTFNGSQDRSPVEQADDIRALRNVVDDWKNDGICDFDDAVKTLCIAAIKEVDSQ